MDGKEYRAILPRFNDATEKFYSGEMSVKEYKGISGGFGSYAQRGGKEGMVRFRLSGGVITKDKLGFICDCIRRYNPKMVHMTTCQSVQLHGLAGPSIPKIVDGAIDHDILTYGGGGDYPRNVTATPLSGVIRTPFDVQPYAECAGRFLLDYTVGKKLPRKLKVGFSNTAENMTDATARDLGFVAKENGKFDVYSGGGLGNNPRLGLLVREDAEPEDVCFYLAAMVDMFIACGDYENRSHARVRYMRDSLGDDGYIARFNEEVGKTVSCGDVPKVHPAPRTVSKKGDGTVPGTTRARPQIQEGLFYLVYHPIGGDPAPKKVLEIYDAIKDIPDAEIRIGPNETMYFVNLTGSEADMMAEVTSDGARTVFESSVSCVGSTICQIGLRDSRGLLDRLISMERGNGFADGVLPMIRISGCVSSCAAHQLGTVGLRGGPAIEGEASFVVSVNGSHVRGKERIGDVVGSVKESEVPAFFEAIGKAVQSEGTTFREWYGGDPERIKAAGGRYLRTAGTS